jgi:hypothetical protein
MPTVRTPRRRTRTPSPHPPTRTPRRLAGRADPPDTPHLHPPTRTDTPPITPSPPRAPRRCPPTRPTACDHTATPPTGATPNQDVRAATPTTRSRPTASRLLPPATTNRSTTTRHRPTRSSPARRTPLSSYVADVRGDDGGCGIRFRSAAWLRLRGECPSNRSSRCAAAHGDGRFVREAAAVDPGSGFVYLTEDEGPGDGFYTFRPAAYGVLFDGVLEMTAIAGSPGYDTRHSQIVRTWLPVQWGSHRRPRSGRRRGEPFSGVRAGRGTGWRDLRGARGLLVPRRCFDVVHQSATCTFGTPGWLRACDARVHWFSVWRSSVR